MSAGYRVGQLKHLVTVMLRHYVPEVTAVEAAA